MSVSVLLLGCGQMGRAMLQGWLKAGLEASITVIDPNEAELRSEFASHAVRFMVAADDTLQADFLVLAIKPQKMREVLPLYRDKLRPGGCVLSIAAGVKTKTIAALMQNPGLAAVRAMPNLPASIGAGIAGAFAVPSIRSPQRDFAGRLLGSLGKVVWLEREEDLNPVTALSGSGPAYIFSLCQAMAQAGEALGLAPNVAALLARETVIGSAALMNQSKDDMENLRRKITSPGGTTEAALRILDAHPGMRELMQSAIVAASKRAEELSDS